MTAPSPDFEGRIRRIEDRQSIRDLVSRYTLAMDDKDYALAETLFAPEARFGWDDGSALLEGRDAIMAYYRSRLPATGPSFHVTHDQVVDFDPLDADRARGLVACHAEITPPGAHHVAAIRYRDLYRRTSQGWQFAERRLSFLYNVPANEYPGILLQENRIRVGGALLPAHWPQA